MEAVENSRAAGVPCCTRLLKHCLNYPRLLPLCPGCKAHPLEVTLQPKSALFIPMFFGGLSVDA